ncbi:MAG: response regulator, partial [Desulfobacteraceae bacterium]|nr:response regulator [Desulfobacteraceae bacterium]
DFSKIEAGNLECEIIDFDLRTTIEKTEKSVSVKAKKKGLAFDVFIHQLVPSLLKGDPGRLRQILNNLSENAVKFTDQGKIKIIVTLEKEDTTSALIHFEVIDTGIGISSDEKNMIFKSFSQADGSTTRKYGGTGLGLAISKKLVDLMNGKIGVDSKQGHGSSFWFTALFEKQTKNSEEKPIIFENIKNKKILIVDDNATNCYVLKKQVQSWECDFDIAENGKEALEKLTNNSSKQFDIALLDMQMPEMDGETLAKKIKSNPDFSNIILIMLTSLGQKGDGARLKKIGCAAYLPKPVKPSLLSDCIIKALTIYKQGQNEFITRYSLKEGKKQNIHILLAQDNIASQKLYVNILNKSGYRVDTVLSGHEAIKAFETGKYNLVLLNESLSEIDGFEVTKKIRTFEKQQRLKRTPILGITANAFSEDRERCLARGMNEQIPKTIDSIKLIAIIEKWAEKNRTFQKTISNKKEGAIFNLKDALERAMD